MYKYLDGSKNSRAYALSSNINQVLTVSLARTVPKKGSPSAGVEIQRHSINIVLPVKVNSDCSDCQSPATISVNLSVSSPVVRHADANALVDELDRIYDLIKANLYLGFLPTANETLSAD